MLLFFFSISAIPPAYAQNLKNIIEAAALSGALTTAQSQQFQTITSTVTQLAGIPVSDAVINGDVISGEVEFFNLKWTLLAFSNGKADNTFVTFGPKQALTFDTLFKGVPGSKLLDIIRFDEQVLAFALQDISLSSTDLPDSLRNSMDRFFDTPHYNLKIQKGLTQLGSFSLEQAPVLNNAFEFLGGNSGKAGRIQASVALKGDNVLGDLLSGKTPVPHIKLTAPLPMFRPSIGGKLTLPVDIKMSLVGELQGKQANLGYLGTTAFVIGGQVVDMNLDTGITLRAGAPEFAVTASTFKGKALKKAFGVNWLTIEDYRITFAQEADALKIGFGGNTTVGEKQFDVFAQGATSVKTLGVPIPEKIQLSINDGPDKVGALTLRDITSIFVEMLNATGQNIKLPKAFPDLAITGVKKGTGPAISLVLNAAGNAGIDISGGLRILGTEVGVIERAFVQADTGIEIKARTAKLGVGPIIFPTADVDVSLQLDGLNLTEPRAIIKAKALSLFGSDNGFDLIMRPAQFELKALSDFGSLFKFNFLARTEEQIKSLKHLENTDFQIAAELSSDPSEWVRTAGKRAVEDLFGSIRNVLDDAQRALKDAQDEVATLDVKIQSMTDRVNSRKEKRADQLQVASDTVDELTLGIKKLQSQIDTQNNSMQSCNQMSKLCVLSLPVKTGCLQDSILGCVIPKMNLRCQQYANIPNAPAIAECAVTNAHLGLKLVGLETAKGTLMASLTVAQATLSALRDGVKSIPVELDPRISSLIIAREVAMFTLKSAEETVKGVSEFTRILPQGIDIIGSPDIFALETSSIQGSMRNAVNGKPVVLDMNFRMLGERYQQRLAFSLTDMPFNARQFEVIALGAAVNLVMKLGQAARIIPHGLLDEVQGIYNLKRAAVDVELNRAIASNPITTAKNKLMTLDDAVDGQYKALNKVRLMGKREAASNILKSLR